jgi:RNA polymerase sigma factor (sigma-70 family)
MEPRSDGDLLAAWHAGHGEAFEALVNRYQARLLRHARSFLGEGRAYEDVVQETFLRLADHPPVLAEEGDPRAEEAQLAAWLFKVTRNCCMDAQRSEQRRRRREEEMARTEAVAGGHGRVEGDDTRAAVERSLQRLPDDQREVLALRLFGERSYKEIAELTGKKIGTVGWLISEGLKALSQQLAPLVDGARPGAMTVALEAGARRGNADGGRS